MSERPQVGDWVRVVFEGRIIADDRSSLPFRIRRNDDDEHGSWARVEDVTVVPPQPDEQPVRSDTAIERRLVALEGYDFENRRVFTRNASRLETLDNQVAQLRADVKHWSDNGRERLATLERQMAALRSLFNEAGKV